MANLNIFSSWSSFMSVLSVVDPSREKLLYMKCCLWFSRGSLFSFCPFRLWRTTTIMLRNIKPKTSFLLLLPHLIVAAAAATENNIKSQIINCVMLFDFWFETKCNPYVSHLTRLHLLLACFRKQTRAFLWEMELNVIDKLNLRVEMQKSKVISMKLKRFLP